MNVHAVTVGKQRKAEHEHSGYTTGAGSQGIESPHIPAQGKKGDIGTQRPKIKPIPLELPAGTQEQRDECKHCRDCQANRFDDSTSMFSSRFHSSPNHA